MASGVRLLMGVDVLDAASGVRLLRLLMSVTYACASLSCGQGAGIRDGFCMHM